MIIIEFDDESTEFNINFNSIKNILLIKSLKIYFYRFMIIKISQNQTRFIEILLLQINLLYKVQTVGDQVINYVLSS